MKRFCSLCLALALVAALMVMEYRVIMGNIRPYYDGGFLCLEVFGQVDQYYIE